MTISNMLDVGLAAEGMGRRIVKSSFSFRMLGLSMGLVGKLSGF